MILAAPSVRLTALGLMFGFLMSPLQAVDGPPGSFPAGSGAVAAVIPVLPPGVASAMEDGRFAEAASLLEAPAREASSGEARGYYGLIQGVALRLADRVIEAHEVLEKSLASSPKGPWSSKLRAELAVVELASGRPKEAEVLARAQVENLLAGDRKDRLAEGLRTFAAHLLTSDDPLARLDPSAAHALLVQARSLARGDALRARLLFEQASASFQANDPGKAIEEFRGYVGEYPAGLDRDAARFFLGEAKKRFGQTLEGRLTWSDLARDGSAKDDFRARALFMVARSYGKPSEPIFVRRPGFESVAPGLSALVAESQSIDAPANDLDLSLQVTALRRLVATVPRHPLAVKAAYEVGALDQARGKAEEALSAYRAFLRGEGYQAVGEDSRRLVAELTPSAMFAIAKVLDSQGKFEEAITAWSAYLSRYPSGSEAEYSQRAILDARLKLAKELGDRRQFAEARGLWVEFAARNTLDPRVAEVLYRVAESYKLEGKPDEAIVAFESLIARFPDKEPGRHARLSLGNVFETEKGDPVRAIEQYRSLPPGLWQAQARLRIALLERPSLQVVTPRSFRAGELAHLRITSRNLAKLNFTAYKLDPEAYFRKKLAFKGVEALDVGLVAPDAEWSEPVPGFARYKPVDAIYELKPLEGHGFWAVKVSDESTLQATTMVLRSNLDAVVRASREQALVFVQDRKTGLGRKGARVLLHDGKETLLESLTNVDGVVLLDWPADREIGSSLNYLVLDDLEAAGSALSLSGQRAVGLSPRLYLYTDRPAYRPGQSVEIRGVVRDVVDGAYAFTVGEGGQLDVLDPLGRRVATRAVKLSKFGTFHESVTLASGAPVGEYSFRISRPDKGQSVEHLRVESYVLEKADLVVDLTRTVVFRGEIVKAEVVARSRYGAPLAGRPVEVVLPDGRTLRGVTGPGGKFPFEFATEGFAEEQPVEISARLPEDNVAASAWVVLALRAYRIDLATDREVYLAGETFRLRATTFEPLGKPVGQTLAVSILKRVDRGGPTIGEREVGSSRLETDAKTGRGEVALKVDDEEGGSFVVRVSGLDHFGNAIVEDRPLVISGRGDSTRLRFLADRTSFKVGEPARLDLHNREGSGLTLLTWESERILRYKLVNVKPGGNSIDWLVEGPEFPNFTLAAARMDGDRLDEARIDLRVERDLRIGLKPLRPSVGPGEEVVVEVTTLDQLDRPVAAELSLALVDRALLRIHADAVPPIGPFFHDRTRTGAFSSGASNGFRYAPKSRPVAGINNVPVLPLAQAQEPAPAMDGSFGGASTVEIEERRTGRPRRGAIRAGDLMGEADDPTSKAILAKLGEAVAMNFPTDTPLQEVKKYIEQVTKDPGAGLPNGIPIYVDPIGLQDVDKTMESTVTINFESVPLRTTLRLILQQLSMTYSIQDGLLTITSTSSNDEEAPDEAGGFVIGGGMGGGMGGMGGSMGGGGLRGGPPLEPGDEPGLKQKVRGTTAEAQTPAGFPTSPRPPQGQAIALAPARQQFVETAFWKPDVVTGPDGKARVTFRSPSALSEYVFMARGITGLDTLAGQATADLAVRKSLFVDLRTPPVAIQGDRPRFSAKVHHSGIVGRVEVKLALYAGERQQVDPRTLDVAGDGIEEVGFDSFEVPDGDVLRLVLSARAGDQADELVVEIPIKPWGVSEYATASGTSSDDVTAFVSLPAGRIYEGAEMVVAIAPTTERLIVDAALGKEAYPTRGCVQVESSRSTLDVASELLATASALEYLGAIGSGDVSEHVRLEYRAKGFVTELLGSQNEDGGWAYFSGVRGSSSVDGLVAASIVWALTAAERVGLLPDTEVLNRSIAFLTRRLAQAEASDHVTRAALIHALALRGRASFEAANALNRLRDDLSDVALGYLSLTYSRTDRPSLAAEVLVLLTTRAKTEPGIAGRHARTWWSGDRKANGAHSSIEATALVALAFAQARAPGTQWEGAVEWLLAHRSGVSWRPTRANGAAVAALSTFYARGKVAGDRYRLVVQVNGREVDRFDVTGRGEARPIAVPRAVLKADGVNQVSFDIEGRGTFGYSVTMTGFTRTFEPSPGAPRPAFALKRTYLAAPAEFEGRALPVGFSAVVTSETFENPTKEVSVGGRIRVSIEVDGLPDRMMEGAEQSYLILEEPLPAGATLIEGSVRSGAVLHRLEGGVLSFYFAPGQAPSGVAYELMGLVAGRYRALPPRLREVDNLGQVDPRLAGRADGPEPRPGFDRPLSAHSRRALCPGKSPLRIGPISRGRCCAGDARLGLQAPR